MKTEKFKNLVHYICSKVNDPSKLGSTKLNKILYYSDFIQFQKTGESITGEVYVKRQHGPVPYDILKVEKELISEDKLVKSDKEHFGYIQKQYFSLKEPNLSSFNAEEISLVDELIDLITERSAAEISEVSHNHIWEAAKNGQEIPYETAFVNKLGDLTEDDVKWATNLMVTRKSESKHKSA